MFATRRSPPSRPEPRLRSRHGGGLSWHCRARFDPSAERAVRREEVPRPGAGHLRPGALEEFGTDYFQEVDDLLFKDVALFTRTVITAAQATGMLEQAVQAAMHGPGVAVLTLPGDVDGRGIAEGRPCRSPSS